MKISETYKNGIAVPQKYEAPAIDIIRIEVEKGFDVSPLRTDDNPPPPTSPDAPNSTWGAPW